MRRLSKGYYVKDEEVDESDKAFPPKTKLRLPGQIWIQFRAWVARGSF